MPLREGMAASGWQRTQQIWQGAVPLPWESLPDLLSSCCRTHPGGAGCSVQCHGPGKAEAPRGTAWHCQAAGTVQLPSTPWVLANAPGGAWPPTGAGNDVPMPWIMCALPLQTHTTGQGQGHFVKHSDADTGASLCRGTPMGSSYPRTAPGPGHIVFGPCDEELVVQSCFASLEPALVYLCHSLLIMLPSPCLSSTLRWEL